MKAPISQYLEMHNETYVLDARTDYEVADDSITAQLKRVALDDLVIEPNGRSNFILSLVRGQEEWLMELSGARKDIEMIAQFSFRSVEYVGGEDAVAEGNGDPAPKSNETSKFPVFRELTNKEGKTITAVITEVSATKVKFTTSGQEFTYDIADLSEEDQAFLKGLQ